MSQHKHRSTSVPRLGTGAPCMRQPWAHSALLDPFLLPAASHMHLLSPQHEVSVFKPPSRKTADASLLEPSTRALGRNDSGASLYYDSESDEYERRSSRGVTRGRRCRRTASAASSQPSSCASYSYSSGVACSSGYGSSDYLATAESEIDQLLLKDNHSEPTTNRLAASETLSTRLSARVHVQSRTQCAFKQPAQSVHAYSCNNPSSDAVADIPCSRVAVWPGELSRAASNDIRTAPAPAHARCCDHCPISTSRQQHVTTEDEERDEESAYATIHDVMSDKDLAMARQRCGPPALPPRCQDWTESPQVPRRKQSKQLSFKRRTKPAISTEASQRIPRDRPIHFAHEGFSQNNEDGISIGVPPVEASGRDVVSSHRIYAKPWQPRRVSFEPDHSTDFVQPDYDHQQSCVSSTLLPHSTSSPAALNDSTDSVLSFQSTTSWQKQYTVSDVLSSIQRLGCVDSSDSSVEEDSDYLPPSSEVKPPRPQKPAHLQHLKAKACLPSNTKLVPTLLTNSGRIPSDLVNLLEDTRGIMC